MSFLPKSAQKALADRQRNRRRPRGRLPTVRGNQIGEARLGQGVRQRLSARAEHWADVEATPEIQALRGEKKSIKRTMQTELEAAEGAGQMLQAAIAQASRGLGKTGLQGRYKSQVAGELAHRQVDAAAGIPFMQAGIREEGQAELAAARQDVQAARADRSQLAATKLQSYLSEAHTDAESVIKDQQAERDDKRKNAAERKKELRLAIGEAQRLLRTNPAVPGKPKTGPPEDDAQWALFEDEVAKAEGIGLGAAKKATEALRRKQEKENRVWRQPWAGS